MKKFALRSAGLGAMLVCLLPTMQAHAQFWVASNGGGTTCSRSLPCATFQAAHDAASAGVEIKCVDAHDYGPVTITKSITIDCTGVGAAVVTSASHGVVINLNNGTVRLRGLHVDGKNTGTFGLDVHTSGGQLSIEKCRISRFSGDAIVITASGLFKLFVSDSVIENNGGPNGGSGMFIQAGPAGRAGRAQPR